LVGSIFLLLAEDEALISLSAQDALQAGGYSVVTAASGSEAMAVLESRAQELAGVITDIRLGEGPSGWEVATRARELKPDIAIIYATADSAHEWSAHGVPKSKVIQKPYAAAQVVTAISALLTEAQTNDI
jgi:CheY-like chemotaxis protein